MRKFIEIENVSKVYSNKKVINNLSLTVDSGKVIAILGGNGTGKSTLLRLIACVEAPSSGKIIYSDKNCHIGYVPERFPKGLHFTPSEYLFYMGKINGIPKTELKKMIRDYLQRFKLKEFDDRRISELSKGNIQKVGIIQAILKKPQLFILDEPLSGLDSNAQQELLIIIKELKQQGTTTIITYHESNVLEPIVDIHYILKDGVISKENKPNKGKKLLKLLKVKYVDELQMKEWEKVISIEEQEDLLLLYVEKKHSDHVLSEILKLNGSIESVVSVECEMPFEKDKANM